MDGFANELVWLVAIILIGGIALVSASSVVQAACVVAILIALFLRTSALFLRTSEL